MKSYLQQSEKLHVGIDELEYDLFSLEGGQVGIVSAAENARDEEGYSWFVVFDTRRGTEVADATRFAELARNKARTWKKT